MYKTSSEILKDYKKLKALIKDYDLQLQELDFNTLGPQGMTYDKDKTSPTNKFNSDTENAAIKREEKIHNLKKQQGTCKVIVGQMDNALDTLTDREKQIIELKYFNGKTYDEISAIIDRTSNRIKHIMKDIREKLDNLIFKQH